MTKKAEKNETKVTKIAINKCQSFADVQKYIKSIDNTKITFCMDRLLSKGGTYAELLKAIEKENTRLGSNDYKTVGRIKSHVAYRKSHDFWTFEGDAKKVRLTGFSKPTA